MQETAELVDFINIMTYDYKGSWLEDSTTGHQSALYGNGSNNANWAVQYYLAQGVHPQDIVLGVPLYGRYWTNVDPGVNGDGLGETGTVPFDNYVLYKDLYEELNNGNYVLHQDSFAQVPYLYSTTLRQFSTYEDVSSVTAKAQYVKDLGIGGMFFWEISGDLPITDNDSLIRAASSSLL